MRDGLTVVTSAVFSDRVHCLLGLTLTTIPDEAIVSNVRLQWPYAYFNVLVDSVVSNVWFAMTSLGMRTGPAGAACTVILHSWLCNSR